MASEAPTERRHRPAARACRRECRRRRSLGPTFLWLGGICFVASCGVAWAALAAFVYAGPATAAAGAVLALALAAAGIRCCLEAAL